MKKGLWIIIIVSIILIAILVIAFQKYNPPCTEDAKICPDGTVVGRTGPNCEFKCPIQEKTYCQKNEDCIIVDNNNLFSCCHGCGKVDFSLDNFMSVNQKWFLDNKNAVDCSGISCPACVEEYNPENEKWTSKCENNSCKKVLK